jgi:hypothetical protein
MVDLEQPPIGCCLSAGDYQRRIAWIGSLARQALQKHDRDDLVLRLVYAPEAAEQVREMVEREHLCCAGLTFDLPKRIDAVNVVITAPENAREAAEDLFGQFVPGGTYPSGELR